MPKPLPLNTYSFGDVRLRIAVPDAAFTEAIRKETAGAAQPYWAKVWPASLALCSYLAGHPELVRDREVLELGAGLGLPGLVAAQLGGRVTLSDREAEAVALMKDNAGRNGGHRPHCRQLDWSALPEDVFSAELLLLSDVNYDPAVFGTLHALLLRFLSSGAGILLSSPQRLMAKPFIERMLPFVAEQEERFIETESGSAWISIFLLRCSKA